MPVRLQVCLRLRLRLRRCVPRRAAAVLLPAAIAVLFLQGCATVAQNGRCNGTADDPFEPLNREVFGFNRGLDRAVIKPAAKAYRAVLPEYVRDRIRAVVDNLKEPLVFVNDVLQGRGGAAVITGQRFVINSTLGVVGLFDRATGFGFAAQSGDFGQTLYRWGVAGGPYLVLPLFGPSNVRDSFGLGVDVYASPLGYVGSKDVSRELSFSTGVADGIDLRARNIDTLDEVEANSLDFYAYLRSITRQQRQAVLRDAVAAPGAGRTPIDELVDPGDAPAPAPASLPAAAPASVSGSVKGGSAAGC